MFSPTLGQISFGGVHEQTYIKQVVTVGCFDPLHSRWMAKKVNKILGLREGNHVPMTKIVIPGRALSLVRAGNFSRETVDIEKQWKMVGFAFAVINSSPTVLVLSAHTPCLDGCEDAERHLRDAIRQAKKRFPAVIVHGILHHVGGKNQDGVRLPDHTVTVL